MGWNMHLLLTWGLLGALLISTGYGYGYGQDQVALTDTKPSVYGQETTVDFDDLPTDKTDGIGPRDSFRYNDLTFNGLEVVNIPAALKRPGNPMGVSETACVTSAPNVVVGSRHNTSNLWPTISLCDLPPNASENKCNGTFSLVSMHLKPMGSVPVGASVIVVVEFVRLGGPLEFPPSTEGSASSPLDRGLAFPLPQKRHFTLVAFYRGPGWHNGSTILMRRFRPGFATGVDTMQIYGRSAPLPGSDLVSVDWQFCLDDLVFEFSPDGEDESGLEDSEMPDNGFWREEVTFETEL